MIKVIAEEKRQGIPKAPGIQLPLTRHEVKRITIIVVVLVVIIIVMLIIQTV